MRLRRTLPVLAGGAVGFLVGAVLTLSIQSAGRPVAGEASDAPGAVVDAATVPEPPGTYLAWTPGGLPAGFRRGVASLPEIDRAVIVASDNTWMTRSFSEQGHVVDDPPQGFAIPIEVAAVEPKAYAPFLPPADRGVVVALQDGQGVLGRSSAELRQLGPGAVLRFGRVDVQIAAVLPDELMGAHELLVSREVGLALGVRHERYALLQPSGDPTTRRLAGSLRGLLPPGLPLQVRAPGDTPYFRQGDAVLPPVQIKLLFGEFAARPAPGRPGYLEIERAWERSHIATQRVPLLGHVTCNVAMFPQIRGAIREIVSLGLSDEVRSFAGCYARRYANRDPSQALSHHAWGIALDINVPQNPYGAPPDQDPRMVAVFERWGFIWGGGFVRPDGMHFEYHRPPEPG